VSLGDRRVIVLFLSGEEAQQLRDRVSDLPDVAKQLDGFSQELLFGCAEKPALSIWFGSGNQSEDVYSEAFAAQLVDAMKQSHRAHVQAETHRVPYRKRRKLEKTA